MNDRDHLLDMLRCGVHDAHELQVLFVCSGELLDSSRRSTKVWMLTDLQSRAVCGEALHPIGEHGGGDVEVDELEHLEAREAAAVVLCVCLWVHGQSHVD